jgi:hypothetical protein
LITRAVLFTSAAVPLPARAVLDRGVGGGIAPLTCLALFCVLLLQGTLWLSGIAASIAYNWSRPGMKTSVKIIHARSVTCTRDLARCISSA